MSRIGHRFESLRQTGRTALIPYLMAGDPGPEQTAPLMHALVEAGADLIELGVPFSDPMADGPVIQAAGERALARGMTLTDVIAMVRTFRAVDQDTPVLLMGYLNPIEAMGYETFVNAAAAAGVDGVLTVDLPPEESAELVDGLYAAGLDPIFLVAPTTTPDRLREIARAGRGFLYYVSLRGVTGSSALDIAEVRARLQALRGATDLPVGVGFGIGTPDAAAEVSAVADAVVVGSALVKTIAQQAAAAGDPRTAAAALISSMRQAMDRVATG